MPKIIPELRQRLLDAARRRLLESDAHDLSIRQIAADCHTAVGTVYNYFPSKEALMAAAMMGDWLDCVEAMQAAADARNAPMETMREIVMALRRFASQCAPIWRNYSASKDSMDQLALRHRQVIDAITGPVETALRHFDRLYSPHLPEVLSELILMASRTEDGFERIAPALERILS